MLLAAHFAAHENMQVFQTLSRFAQLLSLRGCQPCDDIENFHLLDLDMIKPLVQACAGGCHYALDEGTDIIVEFLEPVLQARSLARGTQTVEISTPSYSIHSQLPLLATVFRVVHSHARLMIALLTMEAVSKWAPTSLSLLAQKFLMWLAGTAGNGPLLNGSLMMYSCDA